MIFPLLDKLVSLCVVILVVIEARAEVRADSDKYEKLGYAVLILVLILVAIEKLASLCSDIYEKLGM